VCHCGQLTVPNLTQAFPDAKALIALEPEELGPVVLQLIHSAGGDGQFRISLLTACLAYADPESWPARVRISVDQALAEAFAWLGRVGLIMPAYGATGEAGLWVLTRRGKDVRTEQAAHAYKEGMLLPEGLVHPLILQKTHAAFLRGDHDIAVLSAFKAIEVAVRKAASSDEGEIGVRLMRTAFEPDKGLVADWQLERGEQQAQADLFAGAIGAAKNPGQSSRCRNGEGRSGPPDPVCELPHVDGGRAGEGASKNPRAPGRTATLTPGAGHRRGSTNEAFTRRAPNCTMCRALVSGWPEII